MNGYTLTKKLKDARITNRIEAGAQALFHELIDVNNSFKWSETFFCKSTNLMSALSIEKRAFKRFRQQLVDAGLIVYVSGRFKGEASVYSMHDEYVSGNIAINLGVQIAPEKQAEIDFGGTLSGADCTPLEEIGGTVRGADCTPLIKDKPLVVEVVNAGEEKSEQPQTPPAENKEKGSAEKESSYPSSEEAIRRVGEWQIFRECLKEVARVIKMQYESHNEPVFVLERTNFFNVFWMLHEDQYRVEFIEWNKVAKHFYFWISKRADRTEINAAAATVAAKGNAQTARAAPGADASRVRKANNRHENLMNKFRQTQKS